MSRKAQPLFLQSSTSRPFRPSAKVKAFWPLFRSGWHTGQGAAPYFRYHLPPSAFVRSRASLIGPPPKSERRLPAPALRSDREGDAGRGSASGSLRAPFPVGGHTRAQHIAPVMPRKIAFVRFGDGLDFHPEFTQIEHISTPTGRRVVDGRAALGPGLAQFFERPTVTARNDDAERVACTWRDAIGRARIVALSFA